MNIKYPLVLDGGLSNQLESQGCNLNHKLWSAKLLISDPEAIKQAHLAYLEAGAQCILTSSYQATIKGFMTMDHDQKASETLIRKSVKIAQEAIKEFHSSTPGGMIPLVAASIGPYGAFLADGSEYIGDYGLSDKELTDFHLPRIQLLDDSGADFLACETIPSFQEARILADILSDTGKPAWISFSCWDDRHIHDGTPIDECTALFAHHTNVFAIGVNCTAPSYISPLIKRIKKRAGDKRVVVYPNSGEIYHADTKTWSDSSDLSFFQSMVNEWLDLGADIIGGCCRLGPEYIEIISQVIKKRF